MTVFCYIAGILCVMYCAMLGLFMGHGTNFFLIWGVLGVLFCVFGLVWKKGLLRLLPRGLKITLFLLFSVGALAFLIVEGCIFSGFSAKTEEELDYIIVLGAQLKESGPSRVLQKRLDKAYEYLTEHKNTRVIVSGGQGPDEPDTEAEGMYRYLVKKGITPERIIKEDQSRNTVQNIEFSAGFLDKKTDKVGIVSNNFHIFRAVGLARHAGYEQVCGIAAPSELPHLPNNLLREFFGVMKDLLRGNLI